MTIHGIRGGGVPPVRGLHRSPLVELVSVVALNGGEKVMSESSVESQYL